MEIIGTIEVSEKTEIRFFISEFKNNKYANIRKFFLGGKEPVATKKGILISKNNLKEIIKLIDEKLDLYKKQSTDAIQKIPLDEDNHLKIAVTEFKGKKYFEIREYVESESYSGPTKKGITINIEHFDKTLTHLKQMDEKL